MNLLIAKEFFKEELSGEPLTQENVIEGLIQFAKLHCIEQARVISEKAVIFLPSHSHLHGTKNVDEDSIINAYNLEENIK